MTKKSNQKAKMARKKNIGAGTLFLYILLALVIVVGLIFLIGGMYYSAVDNTSPGTTTPDGKAQVCSSETTPDVTIKAYDNENPGTAITEVFSYRKVGSTTWSSGTTGTAITGLEAGEDYEILLGVNGTDQTDNAYGEFFTHTVKCQESETIEVAMYNDEVETSLTAIFYNNDDNADAETFSAGETQDVRIKLQAGTDEFFGNPTLADNPNVVVLKLNQSEWDKPEKVYLKDGTELKSVSVPQIYDEQASGFTEYAYELPAISDVQMNVYLKLNADDSNAPSVDGTAYIYAGGYYIDDQSQVASGVEDENDVAVATDAPDSVTLDFTA